MQTIKSFKLLIIALVVCSNVFSQSNIYKPFPDDFGTWIVRRYYNITFGGQYSWEKYEVLGDTVIGSYSYKKVSRATNTGFPNPTIPPFGPSTFNFAYRNDIVNKKVYRNLGTDHDTLWYDFNLNVGSSLPQTYSFDSNLVANNPRKIVQSIDSVSICGIYYKRFNFSCAGDFETDLIEGIGFHDNFIHTLFPDCPFEPSEVDHTDYYCTVTSINVRDVSLEQIKLYPNPSTSEIKINSIISFSNYTITNELGEIVLRGNYPIDRSINIKSILNGSYFIKMQDKMGNYYQSKFIKQ
jgi:hypothetical protein